MLEMNMCIYFCRWLLIKEKILTAAKLLLRKWLLICLTLKYISA
uniref:Uncharacterized protein n=1 Tax=Arundo donax TaxID=35708 RepID=A0A0A9BXU4_ARUDO